MTQPKSNPQIEVRCQASELRANTESRTIVGYAAKFECWSEPIMGWFREKISREAFDGCDMSDVIMCFNHNIDSILARTTSQTLTLAVDAEGLRFEFTAPDTTLGHDMLELVRRGDISKCSFKFSVDSDEWLYADKDNGLEYDERTIRHIARLYDVSLVVYPAYKDTEAGIRHLEERKQQFLNTQHNENDPTKTQEGMALDETEGAAADSQVARGEAGKIHSASRKRTAEFLNLKVR